MYQSIFLVLLMAFTFNTKSVHAHGRLLDPPSRMSAWRFGYPVYKNFLDHGMNCGGRDVQWSKNGGQCGICGDSWSGGKFYERPDGIFVQHNIIPTTYIENSKISVSVQITVPHKGWCEFRICDVAQSGGVEATQRCLNRTILADEDGLNRFSLTSAKRGLQNFTLVLPKGFYCKHCVLQWKWKTGNSWGCDETGCGLGKGVVQEEFYGCSDVTILPRGSRPLMTTTRPTKKPSTVRQTGVLNPTMRDFSGYGFCEIYRMFNIVGRTFDLDLKDEDLDLDDFIPNNMNGEDYLQMIVNGKPCILSNQAKLEFRQ